MKIEKNQPVPQEAYEPSFSYPGDRGRPAKYPFRLMEIGDSVFFSAQQANKAKQAMRKHANRHGAKFYHRAESGGLRIWRVE